MDVSDWLSLDEAARRLSVHPTTLREWADKGSIRTFRTPGGHRRFSESDVAELGARAKPDLSLLMHATVGQARIATNRGRLASEAWYSLMDDEAKQRQRTIGVELVEMLVAFLGDSQRDWTAEIAKLGARYAELAHGAGLSRADAQRAFHLFEGIVRASVDELGAARVGSADLEANVGWFLNEVRVAMVESFA
ncbi:MAG: helix-turn-helix domain-containing protein [Chloroflexi bacterium]|nr:MAG: helix-turn-helix domain-containing protein [Chloroflexota bacterium]